MPAIHFFSLLRRGREFKNIDQNNLLYELCSVAAIAISDKAYYDKVSHYFLCRVRENFDTIKREPIEQVPPLEGDQAFYQLGSMFQ